MKSYNDFYWEHNDCLNKDTSLAHSFGEKVWNHKQQEVDELQKRIDDAIKCMEQNKPMSMDYKHAIKALEILKGENHES